MKFIKMQGIWENSFPPEMREIRKLQLDDFVWEEDESDVPQRTMGYRDKGYSLKWWHSPRRKPGAEKNSPCFDPEKRA